PACQRLRVPELHSPILARRGKRFAIRRECHREDAALAFESPRLVRIMNRDQSAKSIPVRYAQQLCRRTKRPAVVRENRPLAYLFPSWDIPFRDRTLKVMRQDCLAIENKSHRGAYRKVRNHALLLHIPAAQACPIAIRQEPPHIWRKGELENVR